MLSRYAISGLALCLCLGASQVALAAPPAQAAAKLNNVSSLDIKELKDGTAIRIRGSSVPTFSVFKLADPPRLFVDISNSQLSADAAPAHVNNGVITQVATLSVRDATQSVTRVIIGFERAAHYDVRTEGNDVVVFIDGARRNNQRPALAAAPTSLVSEDQEKLRAAQAELAATQQRLSAADGELVALRSKIAKASGEDRERLERERADLNKKIESLRSEERASVKRAELAEARARESSAQAEALKKNLDAVSSERSKLERNLDAVSNEKSQLAKNLDAVSSEKSKLEKSLAAVSTEKSQLERTLNEAASEKQRLEKTLAAASNEKQRLEKSLNKTQTEAQDAARALQARNAELERERERAKQLESQLADLRSRASKGDTKASAELATLERERANMSKRLEQTQRSLEEAERSSTRAQQQLKDAELAAARAQQQLQDAENATKQAQRKLNDLERSLGERDEEVRALRAEVASMRAAQADAQAQRESRPAARAVAVNPNSPNAVRDIRLETEAGRSRIIVELDRPGHFETQPGKNSRAVMILNNTELPGRLERTLRTSTNSGAVRFVSSFADKGVVRMEAELGGQTLETVRQEGSTLVWEFAPLLASNSAERAPIDEDPQPASGGDSFTSARPSVVTDPSKESSVPGMGKKRLSIDLRDADVQNVLRLIAKEGGVNIIAGDDVKGTVTMRLRSVPLDQVFLTMLQSKGLGYEIRGNVIRVAPQEVLIKEETARAEARAASQRLRPLEVFLLPVNYATADELVPQVQGLLSKRGSVSVDARTNMLIIKDLPENLNSIRMLVQELDSQVPQVLIEARIVETNDTFTQTLGIQWGGDVSFSQANGNPTGLIFPSVIGLAGAGGDGQAPREGLAGNEIPNFAVNLPAPVGTGSGGGLGLTLGSLGGAVNLSIRLTALEQAGSARIISAPKILTLDNRQASISQGTSIPISVVGAAGVQTVFVDATLQLTVTPHVTPDGNIQLKIQATKNEPDFQNTGARGDPTIIRRQARTELLIKDGDTTVIGGIYTRNSGTSVNAVPFFHRLPILGFFFRNTSESERRNELLIFITPKIVNRAEALGASSAGSIREDVPPRASNSSDN